MRSITTHPYAISVLIFYKEDTLKSDREDSASLLSTKPIESSAKYNPTRTFETHPGAKYSEF